MTLQPCPDCRLAVSPRAETCPRCGCPLVDPSQKKSVLVAFILWIFLGWLGGHFFYLERTTLAAGTLAATAISFTLLGLDPARFFAYPYAAMAWVFLSATLIPAIVAQHNRTLPRL